jgi:hypothetical protein
MLVPQHPNDRWSVDFVVDQFIDGRRLRNRRLRFADRLHNRPRGHKR